MRVVALQEWHDYNLGWNVTEYGGVKSINLPSKDVWTPDILMYNRCECTLALSFEKL